jgi:hypothetical protein
VILGIAVFHWFRFGQDRYLLESVRPYTYLFHHFSNEGVTGSLVIFAVSTNDIP